MALSAESQDCCTGGAVPALRTYRLAVFCLLLVSFAAHGGILNHSFAIVPTGTDVNLSFEGPVDWIHWGTFTEFAPDRKGGVVRQISDFVPVGNGEGPYQYADNYNGYSWQDGEQQDGISYSTTGVYKIGKNSGFQFTVPADTTTRVLKVYVGTYAARGSFQASLSDGSAPAYSSPTAESVDNQGNGPGAVYTLTYAANSSNKVLTITYTGAQMHDNRVGNVTLQAAALSFAAPSNNPPIVWIDNPATATTFAAPSDILIEASAFDIDGTVTNVEFFEGNNKLGESSLTPYAFVWSNAPAGNFRVTARAVDNNGLTHDSQPIQLFGYTNGGTLSGVYSLPVTIINLTTNGTHDWAHWGLVTSNSFDHKTQVPQQIGNFSKLGTNVVRRLTNDRTQWSWSDGFPTSTANNSATAVFILGFTNGFSFTLPADTNVRTARFYVGLSAARGKFQASLSDASAPAYTDDSLVNTYKSAYRLYSLSYSAASQNQTLQVSYSAGATYDSTFGNVTLSSASLDSTAPLAILTSPTAGSQGIEPVNLTLTAQAFDANGSVALVEFFEGTNKLGEATNTPYSIPWSNVIRGNYSLTAKATDNDGATGISLPINVTVISNIPPTVSLTKPTNGQRFIEGDNVTFTAQASGVDDPIRRVEFLVGNTKLGEVTNTPYTMIFTNPALGTYNVTAVATDQHGGSGTSAPIAFLVVTNEWPSVSISSPPNGAMLYTPTNVSITALAGDSDGVVRVVEFFHDSIKLGERTNAPYTSVWTNAPRGTFQLTARATDDRGGARVSSPVTISIDNSLPIVVLTNPASGSRSFEGTNITLSAFAFDPDGTITRLEFFSGTNKLGELTNAPWSLVWSNVVLGNYQLSARATDNEQAITVSSGVTIQVISNQAPTITLVNPVEGQVFFRATNIILQPSTTDPDGFISRVDFFEGTNKLGEATNAPFSFVWSNAPLGMFRLSAVAYDNWRGSNSSPAVSISVSNSPPQVALTNPIDGDLVFEGTNVNLAALAIDLDGTIQKVEFFEGTNKLGELTNAPWSLVWSNVTLGSYYLRAVATDNDQAVTASTNVSITVVSNQPPIVALTNPVDGQTFFRPAAILLATTATDPDGFISRAEFYEGTNKLGEATNAPFSFVWSNAPLGMFSLRAVAYDNWRGSNSSAAVSISISNLPPQVTLTNPIDGDLVFEGTNVNLAALPIDLDGSIQKVAFFEGTNKLGELTNAPWSLVWSNVTLGSYQLKAVATDNDQAVTASTNVSITVVSNQPPIVALTNPVDGQTFFRPAAILLATTATDPDGFISRVEFYQGANKLGEATNAPFSFAWSNVPLGTFSLTAVAYDNWRGSNSSAAVSISVSNLPPQVALTNLGDDLVFEGTNVNLAALAVDLDGLIQKVEFFEGTNKLGELTNAPWSLVWSNVTLGSYQLRAVATDNDQAVTASTNVSITVVSNQPPIVALTNPVDGQTFFRPAAILLATTATDPDGFISRVEFYEGANKLGEATNAPFSFMWSNAPLGTFSLSAMAYDNWRGSNSSAAVSIGVSNLPPQVTLTNPIDGDLVFEGTNVNLAALPIDLDGLIQKVEFFEGTNKLGELTNAPWSLVWSNVPLGTYQLRAVATDNDQAVTISTNVSITVVSNQPPIVALTNPVDGQIFLRPAAILLATAATDPDGFISRVEFYEGTNKLGEATNAPFSFLWTNAPLGTFSLTAMAYDNWLGIKRSEAATVIVSNLPPLVIITNPAPADRILAGSIVTLAASASDLDGTIGKVEFFEGTNRLGELTNSPWTLLWTNVPLGNYELSAVATDNDKARTVSPLVLITIVSNQPPVISLASPTNTQKFVRPANIPLLALGTDFDGHIGRVEFYESTNKLGEVTNSPFSLVWSNPPEGSYILTAVATDNEGASADSVPTLVSVVTNIPPTVSIIAPTNGQTFLTPAVVDIQASAEDRDGVIGKVEFFANTNKLAESTTSPYRLLWTNTVSGSYTLTARVTDDYGDSLTSNPVQITLRTVPVITLGRPVVFAGTIVISFATASDWIYRLEYAEVPNATNWLTLTNFPGNGSIAYVTNNLSSVSNKFYRVIAQ